MDTYDFASVKTPTSSTGMPDDDWFAKLIEEYVPKMSFKGSKVGWKKCIDWLVLGLGSNHPINPSWQNKDIMKHTVERIRLCTTLSENPAKLYFGGTTASGAQLETQNRLTEGQISLLPRLDDKEFNQIKLEYRNNREQAFGTENMNINFHLLRRASFFFQMAGASAMHKTVLDSFKLKYGHTPDNKAPEKAPVSIKTGVSGAEPVDPKSKAKETEEPKKGGNETWRIHKENHNRLLDSFKLAELTVAVPRGMKSCEPQLKFLLPKLQVSYTA